MSVLYLVRMEDGALLRCSGAPAVLALLRRGGCRLVEGDRAVLLRLLEREQEAVLAALNEEGGHE